MEETYAYKERSDVLFNMAIKLAKRKLASEFNMKEQQSKDSDKTKTID